MKDCDFVQVKSINRFLKGFINKKKLKGKEENVSDSLVLIFQVSASKQHSLMLWSGKALRLQLCPCHTPRRTILLDGRTDWLVFLAKG